MFSIIIPTFNNLNYLSLCLGSIHKNSKYTHEIILHVNEGKDGTINFAKSNNIIHTYSANNIGLCSGVNLAAKKATKDYILYSHDDMYFCPGWDHVLNDEIKNINTKAFYLSGTMIEKNSGHIQLDCGDDYFTFDEKTGYRDFFNDNEMVFYSGISDLAEKISKISKDEKLRKSIGRNGKIKYLKYFNSNLVAEFIINKTLNINSKSRYIWHKN